ncbi:MAG: hypothetical protein ACR2KZ_17580 [Segetibacter sp.]
MQYTQKGEDAMSMVKKSKSALMAHKDGVCDCYSPEVDNQDKTCNFRIFLDGWSFTADAGNAQSRGEIFTPRWIVDKMIVQSGMFPPDAVYSQDYSHPQEEYVKSRVCEPAVGTANYLSTVLYHKLAYAQSLSYTLPAVLDMDKYHTHLLTAVANVYAYDIDAGNLEVSKRRLLSSGKHPLNDAQTVDKWAAYLAKWFNQDSERKKISYDALKPAMQASLDQAHSHWNRYVKDGQGVIDSIYFEVNGRKMPNWLYDQCQEILSKNILVFNGIKESDTLDWEAKFFVPGCKSVSWTWWHFDYPQEGGWHPLASEKEVKLQTMGSQLDCA